jgi:hypothetical protein
VHHWYNFEISDLAPFFAMFCLFISLFCFPKFFPVQVHAHILAIVRGRWGEEGWAVGEVGGDRLGQRGWTMKGGEGRRGWRIGEDRGPPERMEERTT